MRICESYQSERPIGLGSQDRWKFTSEHDANHITFLNLVTCESDVPRICCKVAFARCVIRNLEIAIERCFPEVLGFLRKQLFPRVCLEKIIA
jgi:hypothetical protein